MNTKSSNFSNKFSENLKAIVWFLGLHAFLFIIFLVIICFGLGALVYYDYVFAPSKEEPITTDQVIKFDLIKYQNVINELEARGETVTKTPTKQ